MSIVHHVRTASRKSYFFVEKKLSLAKNGIIYDTSVWESGKIEKRTDFFDLNTDELKALYQELQENYNKHKNQYLKLDMSRGKPCPEQLELSMNMLDILESDKQLEAEDGTDLRNYGGVDAIPEAKGLFTQMLGVSTREIIIGGNSSLNMMYDTIFRAMLLGVSAGIQY